MLLELVCSGPEGAQHDAANGRNLFPGSSAFLEGSFYQGSSWLGLLLNDGSRRPHSQCRGVTGAIEAPLLNKVGGLDGDDSRCLDCLSFGLELLNEPISHLLRTTPLFLVLRLIWRLYRLPCSSLQV